MILKNLYRSARSAVSQRHRYRSVFDVLTVSLLRAALEHYKDAAAPVSVPMRLRPRALPDPVYLRLGNSDLRVFEEIFCHAEYARVQRWGLPEDATILDLGANIGIASLYFDALYPNCRVVAVEPDNDNCRLMERNCRRLINQKRLRIHRAFVAQKDGVAGLESGFDGLGVRQSWAFAKTAMIDEKHPPVPCISIPTLLESSGFNRLDLLKCDIEGSEQELFRSCGNWIGLVRHLVVETHNSWSDRSITYPVGQLYADLRAAAWNFDVLFELQEEFVGIAFLRRSDCP